ncbi:hypothetical protein [Photobacterium halotolerans]|uniref:Lipoprotein n=1 Tax=Photobacterium halotolerans TaxID=265726 RepID=A0A0F5VBD3_9GAMM|nr:hypothetical protein [Photobacterium halotolerans]KKC99071.1 hypothetical protein KY46_14605 [Photobacterium halotolerans]
MFKILYVILCILLVGCRSTPEISDVSKQTLNNEFDLLSSGDKVRALKILNRDYYLPYVDWEVSTKENFGDDGIGYILSGFENQTLANAMTVFVTRPDSWIDNNYGSCSLNELDSSSITFMDGQLKNIDNIQSGCWILGYAGYFGGAPSTKWSQEARNEYGRHLMYSRIRGGKDTYTVSHQVKDLPEGYILIVTYGRSIHASKEYNVQDIYNLNVSSNSDYISQIFGAINKFDSSVKPEIRSNRID